MFVLVVLLLPGHMWGPSKYIAYELVPASSAVSCMSGLSNLDSFRNGRQVAVQLVTYGVLLLGLVQYCSLHSCVIAVKFFFSIRLVSVHVVHPYSSIDTTAAWKRLRFILSVRSDFHMIESLLIVVHAKIQTSMNNSLALVLWHINVSS